MEAVWSMTGDVKCIHPGWLVIEGWDAVRESWEKIFAADADLKVSLRNVSATVIGRLGVVTLVEELTYSTEASSRTGSIMATNIFRNVNGEWKMIHHHGSPLMVAEEDDVDQNFRYN